MSSWLVFLYFALAFLPRGFAHNEQGTCRIFQEPGTASAAIESQANTALSKKFERFLHDGRFRWVDFPEIERKPPNLFPSALQALCYQHLTALPRGLQKDEERFFQGIFNLLRDRVRVYQLMEMVSRDLKELIPPDQTQDTQQTSSTRALLALLKAYEDHYGFGLTLVREPLTMPQLMKILSQGHVIVDRAGEHLHLNLGIEMRVKPGHWRHLQLSHRLQLHLVLRDLTLRPQEYGSPRQVVSLYQRLGSHELHAQLDWSATGLKAQEGSDQLTLFFQLFDSPENNASSPGFFSEYQEYWPEVSIR